MYQVPKDIAPTTKQGESQARTQLQLRPVGLDAVRLRRLCSPLCQLPTSASGPRHSPPSASTPAALAATTSASQPRCIPPPAAAPTALGASTTPPAVLSSMSTPPQRSTPTSYMPHRVRAQRRLPLHTQPPLVHHEYHRPSPRRRRTKVHIVHPQLRHPLAHNVYCRPALQR